MKTKIIIQRGEGMREQKEQRTDGQMAKKKKKKNPGSERLLLSRERR